MTSTPGRELPVSSSTIGGNTVEVQVISLPVSVTKQINEVGCDEHYFIELLHHILTIDDVLVVNVKTI